MNLTIREIVPEEYQALSDLAREIWLEHYTPLIGVEQVHYMIDKLQSPENFRKDLEIGGVYWLALLEERMVGYCAVFPREDHLYLSKLYIRRDMRGRGLARQFMDKLYALTRSLALPAIRLNVNKSNFSSIATYEHIGFTVICEEVNDIGGGYVMDDYVMELILENDEDNSYIIQNF